jgi:hypothetical protein
MTSLTHKGCRKIARHGLSRCAMTSTYLKRFAIGLFVMLVSVCAMAQQKAGDVFHLQGMATAQQPGGSFRFLGQGDPLLEGDLLTTTDKGFAVLALADGTKFTLRPSTTLALDRFAHDQGTETALMRLAKGGVRVSTGLVGKRNPGGMRLNVNAATVEIRGTSFDARICGDDCRQEGMTVAAGTVPLARSTTAAPVIARVVQVSGDVTASLPGKAGRPLAQGAALYEGDSVRTGSDGVAVLGFRDQSKISLNPETLLRIDAYVYNRPQATDSMVISLLKGGLRAFTGLIGKQSANAVTVKTKTSLVGIRGTGMDLSCEGPCVDSSLAGDLAEPGAGPVAADPKQADGLFLLTWQGGTFFAVGPLDVPLDQVGFIGSDGVARLLTSVPDFFKKFRSPRPDQIEVDWDNLFSAVSPVGADGLYVFVRDGHVFILSGNSRIDLGVGEVGYVGQDGIAQRLSPVPRFMIGDPFPMPEFFSQSNGQILQLFGVTLGQPGQEICKL